MTSIRCNIVTINFTIHICIYICGKPRFREEENAFQYPLKAFEYVRKCVHSCRGVTNVWLFWYKSRGNIKWKIFRNQNLWYYLHTKSGHNIWFSRVPLDPCTMMCNNNHNNRSSSTMAFNTDIYAYRKYTIRHTNITVPFK